MSTNVKWKEKVLIFLLSFKWKCPRTLSAFDRLSFEGTCKIITKRRHIYVYHVTWIAYSKPKHPLNSQKWCATARGLPWVQDDSLFWSSITMKRHVVRQLRGTCLPRLRDHSLSLCSAAGRRSISLSCTPSILSPPLSYWHHFFGISTQVRCWRWHGAAQDYISARQRQMR